MTPKIGIDIVENQRIKLEKRFLKRFLTPNEIDQALGFEEPTRQQEFAAGRWAIKEAIFKVVDKEQWLPPNQISIAYQNRQPIILNPEFKKISISISHEKHYSVGVALNWGE